MEGRLIYVTGLSGTDVGPSLHKLIRWRIASGLASQHDSPHIIKLEDHLTALVSSEHGSANGADKFSLFDVLDLPKVFLYHYWSRAYEECLKEAREHIAQGSDVFFTFHASWYHLRNREYISAVDFRRLSQKDAHADLVVTLIDDIYDVRSRLSTSDGLLESTLVDDSELMDVVLKLTLILDWRAFEITLSERVASTIQATKHVVFAVKHPLRTLNALLYEDLRHIYLSHHISSLRHMLASTSQDETTTARQLISSIQYVARELRNHAVVFEPTTIDELRFVHALDREGKALVLPILSERWPPPGDAEELVFSPLTDQLPTFSDEWATKAVGTSEITDSIMPEVSRADAMLQPLLEKITKQINARDHFLVEHCDALVVYRPYLLGHEATGVTEEIDHLVRLIEGQVALTAVVLHTPDDEHKRLIKKGQKCLTEWKHKGIIVEEKDDDASSFQRVLKALESHHTIWGAVGTSDRDSINPIVA
jgi:hypothetical protein